MIFPDRVFGSDSTEMSDECRVGGDIACMTAQANQDIGEAPSNFCTWKCLMKPMETRCLFAEEFNLGHVDFRSDVLGVGYVILTLANRPF